MESFVRWIIAANILAASAAGLLADGAAVRPAESARPNVIVIMSDNQGFGDLSCHGNPWLRTPNLDALHAESVRFTDFHSSPSCAPTRAGVMTGRYPNRGGVWHTIQGRSILASDERTMADFFSAAGYRTAMIGKWHLGDNYPFRPEDRGFLEVWRHGGGGIGQTPDFWNNSYYDSVLWHNGRPTPTHGYNTDVYFERAMEFIAESKREDKPFLIYLPTTVMHHPRQVPDYYTHPYRHLGDHLARYYGMIANFDDNIGRLRANLRTLGLERNTILVYLSDNGPAHPDDMRFTAGMKGEAIDSVYEASHRVPCFIYWPGGGIVGGRDVGTLSSHIDLLPTLMDLANVPKQSGYPFDGASLKPLLQQEKKKKTGSTLDDRILVLDSQRIVYPIKWRNSCVMQGSWRLIDGTKLYDTSIDLAQEKNIAAAHPERVARLRGAYESWWGSLASAHARKPEIVVGHPAENPSRLTCHDWYSDQNVADVTLTWHEQLYPAWNQQMVREGIRFSGGYWAISADRDGVYEFEVRRWPAEIDQPLRAPLAPGPAGPGEPVFRDTRGVALGIRAVELSVDGRASRIDVTSDAQAEVVFRSRLSKGSHRLEALFVDGEGTTFGAYYVYVKRLEEGI